MKRLLYAWLLPALTGWFYALALPPFNHGEMGWLALVPLFFAVEDCRPAEAFRRAYFAGLVFFGLTTWWIIHVSLPGMVALVAFLALYFGLAGLFINRLGQNPDNAVWRNLRNAVVGAAGWVTIEWVRGHFPLGGFGWNILGVTQHAFTPAIQFCRFTGVYGASALMFVINYGLFSTIRRFVRGIGSAMPARRLSWEFYFAIGLFCAAMLDGVQEIKAGKLATGTRPLRFALVQGNIPQNLKYDEREKPMILDRYRSLTETAAFMQVDLILWPETATPDPLRYDPETYSIITNLTGQAHAFLLTGTLDASTTTEPPEYFNAAALIRPDGSISAMYRKTHLVPFGEYVPLRKIMPFLKWFTPITSSFERGREFTLFNVRGINFGTVICFEDTVPGIYRQFVKAGAEFMVNLTNDAWFKDSPAAEMHLANAIFRTVETRRWLVRATNHGVTCAVDQFGNVHAHGNNFVPDVRWLTLNLPAELPVTFYTRYGDVFVAGCAALTGIALLVVWRKRVVV